MKLNAQGKEVVEQLNLLSGLGKESSRNFFESLLSQIIINYLDDEPTYIPFIGTIYIRYKGDRFEGNIKKAILDIDFTPDDMLIKNIGQIQDGDETDIEEIFEKRLQNALNERLENNK